MRLFEMRAATKWSVQSVERFVHELTFILRRILQFKKMSSSMGNNVQLTLYVMSSLFVYQHFNL